MIKRYILSFVLPVIVFISGCSGNRTVSVENSPEPAAAAPAQPVSVPDETAMLLRDLEENGDYVNSRNFPSLIKASVVNESLDGNIHIIDLRSSELYRRGHIKGAVNKRFEELPEYFEAGIRPFGFERIIVVCSDGSISSYTASLLRMMGYGNVFSMRWGMAAWNGSFAEEGWLKDVSGKYESSLEKKVNEKVPGPSMPDLKTGLKTGPEIAAARFRKLFQEGTSGILVTADEVFSNPSKYYVINLERKDKYEDGHIPGAFRYKPESTLGFPEEMASIPADKPVVVYCGTGHNSGFATAYLRLFGYDARTLRYGNNSFMYDKMVSQKSILSWLPFSREEVNDFEVVK